MPIKLKLQLQVNDVRCIPQLMVPSCRQPINTNDIRKILKYYSFNGMKPYNA